MREVFDETRVRGDRAHPKPNVAAAALPPTARKRQERE